jgi:hypothetical protein
MALALRGHRELVLENLALRQQLMAMKQANGRPRLQARDWLFLDALRCIWTNLLQAGDAHAVLNRHHEEPLRDLWQHLTDHDAPNGALTIVAEAYMRRTGRSPTVPDEGGAP